MSASTTTSRLRPQSTASRSVIGQAGVDAWFTAVWSKKLTVVGIDDWAFRCNHRHGTIFCDLERRRVVALLPDCELPKCGCASIPGSPSCRLHGGGYGEAVGRALPDATQVADRWHLMENASAAFVEAVRLSIRAFRSALGAPRLTRRC